MKDETTQKIKNFYTSDTFLWMLVLLGIALRLIKYFHNLPLYFDESNMAIDIINRPFSDFINPSHDYTQTGPYALFVLTKLATEVFGNSEYALRLFPLLFGIMSVFLFYFIAKHYLKPKAVPIALGLFAVLDSLVYYSSLLKSYSGDVFFALLIYILVISIESKKLNILHIMILSLLGAIIVWFSNPAVFVLAGTELTLAVMSLRKKDWSRVLSLLIVFSCWAISFLVYYFVYTRNLLAEIEGKFGVEQFLILEHALMPFPPKSLADIKWFMDMFFETFNFRDAFEFSEGLNLTGVAVLAFLSGCIAMFREKRETFFLLVSPVLCALLAAALHRYPFSGRQILFLTPLLLHVVAEGAETIREKTKDTFRPTGLIVIILLFLYPVSWAAYHVKKPMSRSEIKPVLSYIQDNWQAGDIIYVHYFAQYEFEYYARYSPYQYNFTEDDYITGIAPRGWFNKWKKQEVSKYYNPEEAVNQTRNELLGLYVKELEHLRGRKRVWVLFSGRITQGSINEEDFFLYHLDLLGERRVSFGNSGLAVVYLYDLS